MSEKIFRVWQGGEPRDISRTEAAKPLAVETSPTVPLKPSPLASTKNIIEKNLFDPERGVGQVQDNQFSSGAMQQVQNMVLLGTAILGESRYAIFKEGSGAGRRQGGRAPTGQDDILRLKLGDTVEGFRLSEIHEKKVIFSKGTSKIEITLDFFRQSDSGGQKTVVPTPPQRQPRQATSPRPTIPQRQTPAPAPARRP